MQKVVTLLFGCWFVLYALIPTAGWVLYGVFDEFVATEYCENKENPSCHGRCFVEKITEQEQKSSPLQKFYNFLQGVREHLLLFTQQFFDSHITVHSRVRFDKLPSLSDGHVRAIEHPPATNL